MKKIFKQLSIFAIIVGIATVIGADAFAVNAPTEGTSTAGQSLLDDLTNNLSGTLGTTVGLGVSLIGLYMWIWNQISWGIFVAIGGALLTAFPGIFNSLREGSEAAFGSTIGGSGGGSGNQGGGSLAR